MNCRIVVLTKVARPGQVKTRLAADIGDALAAQLHLAMVDHTLQRAAETGMPISVSLAGEDDGETAEFLAQRGVTVEPQAAGHLGERIRHAMRGPDRTIALGTDCVIFDPAWLVQAANNTLPVAVGPSTDGGYWAIAIDGNRDDIEQEILGEMPWSKPTLFQRTVDRLNRIGVEHHRLPIAYDIDTLTDLRRLLEDPRCPDTIQGLAGSA
jgi:uncharacterized protein